MIAYYDSPIGRLEIKATKAGITSVNKIKRSLKKQPETKGIVQECKLQLEEYFAGEIP